MKADPRILPYFDIPFQHAHPEILKRMGRKGDRETYLTLIRKLREEFPDGVIRSTVMTGFPGENRKSFAELCRFWRKPFGLGRLLCLFQRRRD